MRNILRISNKYEKKHKFDPKGWFREFNRYHGLPKQDAVFFNMSDLICDLASKEDCIIMGRCADAILKKQPHSAYHVCLSQLLLLSVCSMLWMYGR